MFEMQFSEYCDSIPCNKLLLHDCFTVNSKQKEFILMFLAHMCVCDKGRIIHYLVAEQY